jgi:hypothetical protein
MFGLTAEKSMLLEVLLSRHEKPLIPREEYLLLRTVFYESFSYKTGRKAKGVPYEDNDCNCAGS